MERVCEENRGEGRDGIVVRKAEEAPGAGVYTPPVIYVTRESHVLPIPNYQSPPSHRGWGGGGGSAQSYFTPQSVRMTVTKASWGTSRSSERQSGIAPTGLEYI